MLRRARTAKDIIFDMFLSEVCKGFFKDKFGLVLALYWNYSLYSPGHVGHVRSVVLPSDPLSVSLRVRIAKYKSGRKQIDQILC